MTKRSVVQLVPEGTGRQAAEFARQFQRTLLLSAIVGVATGLAVAGFDVVVNHGLEWVLEQPPAVLAIMPAAGLVIAAVLLALTGENSATTDAYVRSYHLRGGQLRLRSMWSKLSASAATLASGCALGFEGPAILMGGTFGSVVEQRYGSTLRRDDAKVMMVAGAAAGVAAVFKAPLTGVVFALEVPYRSDLARRALLPCLVAAGSSYVTYVLLLGTEPVLSAGIGGAPFDLRDLGGGLMVGVVCGVLARIGAMAVGYAKQIPFPTWMQVASAAVGMAAFVPLSAWWFDAPLHLGPGYEAIDWAVIPGRGLWVLVALFAVRALATTVCVSGRAVGGLFIPLVTQGAIVGAIFQEVFDAPNSRLFPIVGIAAFLSAGYRTPLTGVAFVAEATGEPGFLVPALLAAAAAQLVMGSRSFSPFQRSERTPDLAPLAQMPLVEIMTPNPDTVSASVTLDEALTTMNVHNRRWAPVVDREGYVGLLAVADIAQIPSAERSELTAGQLARTDLLPATPNDPVSQVAKRLRQSESDAVAVIDEGKVVGVITRRDVSNVEILLDRLGTDRLRPRRGRG